MSNDFDLDLDFLEDDSPVLGLRHYIFLSQVLGEPLLRQVVGIGELTSVSIRMRDIAVLVRFKHWDTGQPFVLAIWACGCVRVATLARSNEIPVPVQQMVATVGAILSRWAPEKCPGEEKHEGSPISPEWMFGFDEGDISMNESDVDKLLEIVRKGLTG